MNLRRGVEHLIEEADSHPISSWCLHWLFDPPYAKFSSTALSVPCDQ